jgi:anthranilate synthase component I
MDLNLYPDRQLFGDLARNANLIPVWVEILADTETPLSALAKLSTEEKPAFLLESVEGGERWARYSFLGTSARCQIKIYGDSVELTEGQTHRTIEHHGDPLAVLRSLLARYRPGATPGLPRFWGGAVGYLTYEMVAFFEAIPHHWPADQPLASFVVTDNLIIFDNVSHTMKLVAHVFMEDGADPGLSYDDAVARIEAMLMALARPLPELPGALPGGYELTAQLEPAEFRAGVERIKHYIQEGDVIQTVYSQPFVCKDPPHPWLLYRAQRYINPSPYLYYLHMDDQVLVGSSPETMVRLENRVATLRPIAGTRPRGGTEQQDRHLADELLQDPKERAEHLMLVDLGRNDLGRVAEIGTVQVTDLMVVERYSHVMHLVTNITCDLKTDCDAWDLLRATFPAGTLSGAPKVRAMEIIAELEREPRGPYGGAIGYISFTGNMDLAITIRTACISDGRLTVRAGAGIVADSDPELERVETINKARAMHKALQLIGTSNLPRPFLGLSAAVDPKRRTS